MESKSMDLTLRRRLAGAAALLLCWLLMGPAVHAMEAASQAAPDETVRLQTEALAQAFDADVRAVLNDIEGLPRRLLALRSYLRAGEDLRERWSWNDAQVAEFERSPRRRQMLADIQRLTEVFEELNPTFTLYVNTQIRSLGVQLERWNKNRAVGLLADQLMQATRTALADGQALRQFLSGWQPPRAAPLAAPGLSLHGRGQAVDFQIRKGDRIIAGTEAASVSSAWDAAGWTQKLQRAVERSGLPFRGPLLSPREPWHYEYVRAAPDSGGRSASNRVHGAVVGRPHG
jgi:hypothetical protein